MNFTTETFHCCRYGDLEQLIVTEYGLNDFSIIASLECGNDSDHDLGFIDGTMLEPRIIEYGPAHKAANLPPFEPFDSSKYDRENFENWLETKNETLSDIRLIVNDLVKRGVLPAGNWLVGVSW